jgi:hypothetical protein
MSVEEWRDLEEFPNYQVSSIGRVRRINNYAKSKKSEPWTIVKPVVNEHGTLRIMLSVNGYKTRLSVRRLVCSAFHGVRDGDWLVRFKNDNRHDITAQNLYWVRK